MSRNLLFSEYPMFDRIMEERPDLCRRVLETALGVPVDEVRNVVAERTLQPRVGSHGVRLDAWVRTSDALYDVEMQTYSREGLGRRMRYYQSAMDTAMLRPGATYDSLPESFIVFICLHDEFKEGLPVYTFDMICDESGPWYLGTASNGSCSTLPLGRCCQMGRFVVYFGTSPPRRSEATALPPISRPPWRPPTRTPHGERSLLSC